MHVLDLSLNMPSIYDTIKPAAINHKEKASLNH